MPCDHGVCSTPPRAGHQSRNGPLAICPGTTDDRAPGPGNSSQCACSGCYSVISTHEVVASSQS